jgi:hypothetical protein
MRPLVATRILLASCIVLDLLRVLQLGLVPVLFRLGEDGGLTAFHDPHLVIHDWWGAMAGPIAMGITVICMLLVMAGYGTRWAILIGVLAYAQLGHLFPPGDRAVDRIIRTGLLVIMCTSAARPWWKSQGQQIRAWSVDLLKFILVMIYLSAGLAKLLQQPDWVSMTAEPPLLRIMTDPLAAHLDPILWSQWPWLFRLGGWGTIVLELSSVLILTRWCRHWAIAGAAMHVGVLLTMNLGMFSLGMLSFYPILFAAHRSASPGAPAS